MMVLGKAYFDPDSRGAYVDVLVARNAEEVALAWGDSPGTWWLGEPDAPRAFAIGFDHKPGQRKYGYMVFNWSDCEVPIIVHECVHAAENYAEIYLKSEEFKKSGRSERIKIRQELLPCLVENLVSQTWIMICKEKNSQL